MTLPWSGRWWTLGWAWPAASPRVGAWVGGWAGGALLAGGVLLGGLVGWVSVFDRGRQILPPWPSC
jgi:hypothetical protein